ncbi:MAG: LysR family transcriptional regulator [Clostridia bacterium]|nr:LysR family transcriptional regulator [Clostridia bacterium]
MNTRHARIILTILREGSFTAAAKALQITQPTLSQTVRQIETQLGESIFVRGHSAVRLTPAGELYAQAARRIVQTEEQLRESLSLLRGQAEGTLRVGLMHHRSDELLPQVLPDFIAAYPGVRLEVCEHSAQELELLLLRGELDMALLSGENHHPKLEYRQIASEEIVLLAGKKTALAQRIPSGSTIGLREAEHERFILPDAANPHRRYYDDLFSSCGIQPGPVLVCDSVSTAKRCCAGGSLVMLSPFISLLCDRDSMQKLAHYHIGTDAYLPPFYMAHHRETPLAPHAELLFSLVCSRFRAMTAYRP